MAEGARFELAVHEVDAGFQDRWFQPLTHPSIRNEFKGLDHFCASSEFTAFCSVGKPQVTFSPVPNALATSDFWRWIYAWCIWTEA